MNINIDEGVLDQVESIVDKIILEVKRAEKRRYILIGCLLTGALIGTIFG